MIMDKRAISDPSLDTFGRAHLFGLPEAEEGRSE